MNKKQSAGVSKSPSKGAGLLSPNLLAKQCGLKVLFNSAQRKALGVDNNHCTFALKVQVMFNLDFQSVLCSVILLPKATLRLPLG